MATIKICGTGEIEENIEHARATRRRFGVVEIVLVGRVENPSGTWAIKFAVRGDASGKTYQAEWGNPAHMWAACPSTFPSEAKPGAPGAPPPPGAFGRLYLSEQFLEDNQIAAEPKWPPLLPVTRPHSEVLEVYPLKLELTGLEMKSGRLRQATIDLLDTALAAPDQKLELDGSSPVKVRFTQAAFTRFRLPFVPSRQSVKAALAVLKSRADKEQQEIAGALSVIAAALASVASGEGLDAELAKDSREWLDRLFSAAG